eukprot:5079258-Pleurochrysis_carterae.AAC.2
MACGSYRVHVKQTEGYEFGEKLGWRWRWQDKRKGEGGKEWQCATERKEKEASTAAVHGSFESWHARAQLTAHRSALLALRPRLALSKVEARVVAARRPRRHGDAAVGARKTRLRASARATSAG